jgi:hypothetical protein
MSAPTGNRKRTAAATNDDPLGGGPPPSAKTRPLEGFGQAGVQRVYTGVTPAPIVIHTKFIDPVENVADANSIRFSLKTSFNELIWFKENPFYITFEAKMDNPVYGGTAGNNLQGTQRVFFKPRSLVPKTYFNATLNGHSMIGRVEVAMDGVTIPTPPVDDQLFHYQHLNRIFSSHGLMREKYGDVLSWISNASEHKYSEAQVAVEATIDPQTKYVPEKAVYRHPTLEKVMATLEFDENMASDPLVINCGFDGVFPLSCQNNALRLITKQKVENGFLHPSADISITLSKRVPIHTLLERAELTAKQLFDPTEDVAAHANVYLTIKSIRLAYESVTLDDPVKLKKIREGLSRYYYDVPILRQHHLDSGVMDDTKRISLPAGCKFIYLTWIWEGHRTHNAKPNSNMTVRYKFPTNLKSVELSMTGREGLLFREGLIDLDKGRRSPSLREYHADLVRRGLYTKSFENFYPPARDDNVGYDHAFLLDLTPYPIPEGAELVVQMKYNATLSPTRHVLRAFCVVQKVMEYTVAGRWTGRFLP